MFDAYLLPSGAAAMIALAGIGVSQALLVLALRQFGPARVRALAATAPFVGAALALGLSHDPVFPSLAVAGALMALGVWLHLA